MMNGLTRSKCTDMAAWRPLVEILTSARPHFACIIKSTLPMPRVEPSDLYKMPARKISTLRQDDDAEKTGDNTPNRNEIIKKAASHLAEELVKSESKRQNRKLEKQDVIESAVGDIQKAD